MHGIFFTYQFGEEPAEDIWKRDLEKNLEAIRQTFCLLSKWTNQITAYTLHFTASCWCEGATLETRRYPVAGCGALGCFPKLLLKPAKRAQEKMNALMEKLGWKKQLTRKT